MISLDLRPSSSLDWSRKIEEAKKWKEPLWHLELGLNEPYFPLEDELRFQSLSLGLALFSEQIGPLFPTSRAVLYQGGADFSLFFHWSEKQEKNFLAWKALRAAGSDTHLKRLFCASCYINYFQMLAHKLPDEMPLILQLEPLNVGTQAEMGHLLLRERFDHFLVEGISKEGRVGICFPSDEKVGSELLGKLDQVFAKIQEPVRSLSELFLTEEWEGLDMIYVLSETLSDAGKRKLRGFEAAGGEVICV